MDYIHFISSLAQSGFTRVERDDRLLDVFPSEQSEKGIELWEKWDAKTIHLVRIHLPFRKKFVKHYRLPRQKIERTLYENTKKQLGKYKPVKASESEILRRIVG